MGADARCRRESGVKAGVKATRAAQPIEKALPLEYLLLRNSLKPEFPSCESARTAGAAVPGRRPRAAAPRRTLRVSNKGVSNKDCQSVLFLFCGPSTRRLQRLPPTRQHPRSFLCLGCLPHFVLLCCWPTPALGLAQVPMVSEPEQDEVPCAEIVSARVKSHLGN